MASGGVRDSELVEMENKQLRLENALLRENLSALDMEHQKLQLQFTSQRETLSALDMEHQKLRLESALEHQELLRCSQIQAFLLERAKQQQQTWVPPEKEGEQLVYARFGLNMPHCDAMQRVNIAFKSDEEIIVNEVMKTLLLHRSPMNLAKLGIHLTGKFKDEFLRVKIKHDNKLCAFLAEYTKNFVVNVREQTISVRV